MSIKKLIRTIRELKLLVFGEGVQYVRMAKFSNRPMTEAERQSFDRAFEKFDEALDELDKLFDR